MRELHASIISSMDGFYESDRGTYSFAGGFEGDEFAKYSIELLRGYGTLLFGRKTYELGRKSWLENPHRDDSAAIGNRLNTLPKVVFSSTLEELGWGDTVHYKGDLLENVKALKEEPGDDILIIGSTSVRSALINAGLIDRIKIWYFPVMLGSGNSLFKGVDNIRTLEVKRASTFTPSGIIRVEYTIPKTT